MASILDRYGIKEVADVTFYTIDKDTGKPDKPVLFLDSLKVSTIEQTAETADARGGKGNPKLVSWDFGKELTLNLEDALFSPKSMSIMMGSGSVATGTAQDITRTTVVRATGTKLPDFITADVYDAEIGGASRKKVYMGSVPSGGTGVAYASSGLTLVNVYKEDGSALNSSAAITSATAWSSATAEAGKKYFVEYTVKATTKTISISGDTFPGTYYIQGDTYSRSDIDGSDQFFQFIVPKAKLLSDQTITLEAEGDPATFNMSLTVLRPEDGEMMRLVQYDLENPNT